MTETIISTACFSVKKKTYLRIGFSFSLSKHFKLLVREWAKDDVNKIDTYRWIHKCSLSIVILYTISKPSCLLGVCLNEFPQKNSSEWLYITVKITEAVGTPQLMTKISAGFSISFTVAYFDSSILDLSKTLVNLNAWNSLLILRDSNLVRQNRFLE